MELGGISECQGGTLEGCLKIAGNISDETKVDPMEESQMVLLHKCQLELLEKT